MLDSNDPSYLRRELADAQTRGDYWRDQVIPLETFGSPTSSRPVSRTGPPKGQPMIRETRFLISRRPYAVDLTSLRGGLDGTGHALGGKPYYQGRIDAVWFRRRKGVTVACVGTLWDLQDVTPANAGEFLERHTDGRYGGDCDGRWDGERYWGAQEPDVIERHLALLRPMLAGYPAIPDGYDGWWRF